MHDLTIKLPDLPKITWPKQQVQNEIDQLLAPYSQGSIEEETAHKDLANIRRIKNDLDAKKKQVKKTWNKNYTVFEDEIKQMLKQITDVELKVKKVVDDYKYKEHQKKLALIKQLDVYPKIEPYIKEPDPDWFLKKNTIEDIANDLEEKHKTITRNLYHIKSVCESGSLNPDPFYLMLREKPIDEVLDAINIASKAQEQPAAEPDEKTYTITRTLSGTEAQLRALKDYAERIGVRWDK